MKANISRKYKQFHFKSGKTEAASMGKVEHSSVAFLYHIKFVFACMWNIVNL
jgi:hypothetical protein